MLPDAARTSRARVVGNRMESGVTVNESAVARGEGPVRELIPVIGTTGCSVVAQMAVDDAVSAFEPNRRAPDLLLGSSSGGGLDGQVLVLVEEPQEGLGLALDHDPALDPRHWLDRWLAGARALVRLAQMSPDRCLLVDAAEARDHAEAAAHLIGHRFRVDSGRCRLQLARPQASGASRALAALSVAAHPAVWASLQGLRACCVPLADDAHAAAAPSASTLVPRALEAMRSEREARVRGQAPEQIEAARLRDELAAAHAACVREQEESALLRAQIQGLGPSIEALIEYGEGADHR